MRIAVIDGQGGGIGRLITEQLRKNLPTKTEIIAFGTNSIATSLMLKAGALVIPGIGPLIAMGPIAGLLSGAATGGIAGGLIDWGIPEAEGQHYEEDVRQGKTLVSVQGSEDRLNEAADILRRHGAHDVKIF
jgi:uncharacterized membrane protein